MKVGRFICSSSQGRQLIQSLTQTWVLAPVQEEVGLSDSVTLNGLVFLWLLTGIQELVNQ